MARIPDQPPKILLVDDEPNMLHLTQRILNRHGFPNEGFTSAVNAYETLRTGDETPDLVLSDVDMPEMNGLEFYRKVRHLKPHLRFLFVTGSPSQLHDSQGSFPREAGLLLKPFTAESLLRAIQVRMNQHTPSPEE
ncbi:response regulator [Myxococcota bacterium]|nr:response regulator [Myxococcota bacterium]